MLFSEEAIVEYSGTSVKDFVVVEGSKDSGTTWESLVSPYAASAFPNWKSTFDSGDQGSSTLYRTRLINLTSTGKFAAGENILIRFRLSADGVINGWGWAIDDLSIQGPVTGIEPDRGILFSVYPNPSTHGSVAIEIRGTESGNAQLQIVNSQGRSIKNEPVLITNDSTKIEYQITDWADGIYFIRLVMNDGTAITKKFIKSEK
jgi:hypothetical protein